MTAVVAIEGKVDSPDEGKNPPELDCSQTVERLESSTFITLGKIIQSTFSSYLCFLSYRKRISQTILIPTPVNVAPSRTRVARGK